MIKPTWIAIGLAIVLFNILYFGFERKSEEILNQDKVRANEFVHIDVNNLLLLAEKDMDEELIAEMRLLRKDAELASNDSLKIEKWKLISNKWIQLGRFGIAGHFAEEIAQKINTETSWSIAATTFSMGLINDISKEEKDFCARKCSEAYQNAISINPKELAHRLNLSVSLAEYPPKDNPMKGILALLDINKANPDYVPAINALARFGMRTGQFEKAEKRLQKAESLEPNNMKTICLLADLYKETNKSHLAAAYAIRCASK